MINNPIEPTGITSSNRIWDNSEFQLIKLLSHIGFGEQAEAEQILQANPQLATFPDDLVDCAGRRFTKITGFQYAVWALDYHMWNMIKKYLPQEDAKVQMAGLKHGAWINLYGTQASWDKLIEMLQIYVTSYQRWQLNACKQHWCQQVGKEQLMLPAHVINEYNHPFRTFKPCPNWEQADPELPRIGVNDWKIDGSDGEKELGVTFAWARGNGKSAYPVDGSIVGAAKYDLVACAELLKRRQKQAQDLFEELSLSPQVKNRLVL